MLAAAEGGRLRLAVAFGGQGRAWLPLLQQLWAAYGPVVRPFLDRMARTLGDAAISIEASASKHLTHGLDFRGWLHAAPPLDAYLLSAPVAVPMMAVLQLAHVWLCWHILGVPLQELRQRITGAAGHSLGIVSAVVLSTADSEESFLQCSAVGVTLLLRIGLRATEVWLAAAATHPPAEAGATPMMSVAHATLPEVQQYVDQANTQLPPAQQIEIALVNGAKLTVVAGPPSSLVSLASLLRNERQRRAGTSYSTTFVSSSAPFHSSYLRGAVALVMRDVGCLGLRFPSAGAFPVFSTADGTPIPFDENLPVLLATLILTTPVDWVRCGAAMNATHILDFGPPGNALLTQRNRGDDGITVIAASELLPPAAVAPKAALFDAHVVVTLGGPTNSLSSMAGPAAKSLNRNRPTRPSVPTQRRLTPEEAAVRREWAALLAVEEGSLAVDESFFTAGGHSLLAADLAARLGLDISTLLHNPTIAQQAELATMPQGPTALPAIPSWEDQATGPATFQQRQIYLHGQATGTPYEVPFGWEVSMSVADINAALAAVPELRTAFALGPDGQLQQVVRLAAPVVEELPAGAGETELAAWRRSVVLDVHEGPVCRVAVVPVPGTGAARPPRLRLVGVAHHLVTDGLGLAVLRRRMEGQRAGASAPSYLDYARWQAQRLDQLGDAAALRPDLAGAEPVEFAVAPCAVHRRGGGAGAEAEVATQVRYAWPEAWAAELRGMDQPRRFPWLLRRVMRALSRLTTRPDKEMVVLSTVGNRGAAAGLADLVGCFVNTVLYRWADDMDDDTFLQHVLTVQSQPELPLERLGLPLHPESHTPLSPVMVDWHDGRWWEKGMLADDARQLRGFFLVVHMSEEAFSANGSFTDTGWATLWAEIVAPTALARPPSLPAPTTPALPHTAPQWVASCRQHAADVALVFPDGGTLTYAEMLGLAERLAERLAELGV
eukprot:EG_transcript_1428